MKLVYVRRGNNGGRVARAMLPIGFSIILVDCPFDSGATVTVVDAKGRLGVTGAPCR